MKNNSQKHEQLKSAFHIKRRMFDDFSVKAGHIRGELHLIFFWTI
jgi:hypothetical protein